MYNVNRLNVGSIDNLESDQETVIVGDEEEWILTKEQSLYKKGCKANSMSILTLLHDFLFSRYLSKFNFLGTEVERTIKN